MKEFELHTHDLSPLKDIEEIYMKDNQMVITGIKQCLEGEWTYTISLVESCSHHSNMFGLLGEND